MRLIYRLKNRLLPINGSNSLLINGAGILSTVFKLSLLIPFLISFNLLQNQSFNQKILPLVFIGFIINGLLPLRFRLSFFLALSLLGFFLVLGFGNAALAIALLLLVFGLIHLPVPKVLKIFLFGGIVIFLIAVNIGIPDLVMLQSAVTIVGSFLMFRLIIYLYEIRHEKNKQEWKKQLSYFFLLPNLAFLLFPTIDFKVFKNSYYSDEPEKIYNKGADWILRGAINIIIYRIVYQFYAPSFFEVSDLTSLLLYITGAYALAFKISGIFFIIIGILCLFGFNLPPIFNHFLFASSFSDLWRRINIYWKDFMMKVFYFPLYFKFREYGENFALVFSTLLLFIITWFLHAYQQFWILGRFPVKAADIVFWGTFGIVVAADIYLQSTRKQKVKKDNSLSGYFKLGLKTLGVYAFISILWSMWNSPSLPLWVELMNNAKKFEVNDLLTIIAIVGSILFLFVTAKTALQKKEVNKWYEKIQPAGILIILVFLFSISFIGEIKLDQSSVLQAVMKIKNNELNEWDNQMAFSGYYGSMLNNDLKNKLSTGEEETKSRFVEPVDNEGWPFQTKYTLLYSLPKPCFQSPDLVTNQWGMRDKEYQLQKPDTSTLRIAAVGSSYLFGSGYPGEIIWESILEEMINKRKPCSRYNNYEILNFGNGGYSIIPIVEMVNTRVFKFQPDFLFFITQEQRNYPMFNLVNYIKNGVDLKYPFLKELVKRAGVTAKMDESEIYYSLDTFQTDLTKWGYKTIAEACRKNNVVPVWVSFPGTSFNKEDVEDNEKCRAIALKNGFEILEFWDVYDGYDLPSIRTAMEGDHHPNNKGHEIIAKRFMKEILARKDSIGLCN